MAKQERRFRREDVGQIAVGACVMAFPAAVTEEVWTLGSEIELGRALLFALASWVFLGIFIRLLHHGPEETLTSRDFVRRVLSTYWITFIICALLLFGIDRLELLTDPLVALKRTILVTFPASFAATVVDGLK